MTRKYLYALFACALLVLVTSCGQTYEMQSVTLTTTATSSTGGFYSLAGMGATIQFAVLANYSNGKSEVVTTHSTFTVTPGGNSPPPTPPYTAQMNASGMLTAVDPGWCSWTNLNSDPDATPSWFLNGYYKIEAHYDGMTSQPAYVGVASSSGPGKNGECGPTLQ